MISQYEQNLINLSEHKLYLKIKNTIVRDYMNNRDSEYLLTKLYDEAASRSNNLYQNALDDGLKIIESLKQREINSNINSFIRAEYLEENNADELNGIPKDIDINSQEIGKYNLEELTGIDYGNLIISRVSGDSMKMAGIYDGDLIFADTKVKAVNDDIVIASVNNALYVKRIKFDKNSTVLVSENPDYPDVTIEEDMKLSILGKVVNVMHKV